MLLLFLYITSYGIDHLKKKKNYNKLFKNIRPRPVKPHRWIQKLNCYTNPLTHAYTSRPKLNALTHIKTLLPNVEIPNAMLPNATQPNAKLPNVTVPNTMLPTEMLPNETEVNGMFTNERLQNAIVLLLLHKKWNTFASNMGLKTF